MSLYIYIHMNIREKNIYIYIYIYVVNIYKYRQVPTSSTRKHGQLWLDVAILVIIMIFLKHAASNMLKLRYPNNMCYHHVTPWKSWKFHSRKPQGSNNMMTWVVSNTFSQNFRCVGLSLAASMCQKFTFARFSGKLVKRNPCFLHWNTYRNCWSQAFFKEFVCRSYNCGNTWIEIFITVLGNEKDEGNY